VTDFRSRIARNQSNELHQTLSSGRDHKKHYEVCDKCPETFIFSEYNACHSSLTLLPAKGERDLMSTAKINNLLNTILRDDAQAANADELIIAAKRQNEEVQADEVSHTATGWDSYEVWRKFIKEAREKRLSE
jgi:hypothetical protein